MKVANLQECFKALPALINAFGVAQPSLAALEKGAEALESFKSLELIQFVDLVNRAGKAIQDGHVHAVEVDEVAPVASLARSLGKDVQAIDSVTGDQAAETEQRVNLQRQELQTAITVLAQRFGITVKCSETAHWVGLQRAKKIMKQIKPLVTSPESYRDSGVSDGIIRLTALGDPVLKQLAAECEVVVPKTTKGSKLVGAILTSETGHTPAGVRPAREKKAKPGTPDQAQVDDFRDTLKRHTEEVNRDPRALSNEKVNDLIARFKAFTVPQQKEIAKAVTGATKISKSGDAVLRIRSALEGVRRDSDSQT